MAAAQLRLLRIFRFQLFADAVQQLHVALLRVSLESIDEGPGHSTRSLTGNLGILSVCEAGIVNGNILTRCILERRESLRSLIILAARPHDNVSRRSLGDLVALIRFVAPCSLFEESHCSRGHASHVTTSVRRYNTK